MNTDEDCVVDDFDGSNEKRVTASKKSYNKNKRIMKLACLHTGIPLRFKYLSGTDTNYNYNDCNSKMSLKKIGGVDCNGSKLKNSVKEIENEVGVDKKDGNLGSVKSESDIYILQQNGDVELINKDKETAGDTNPSESLREDPKNLIQEFDKFENPPQKNPNKEIGSEPAKGPVTPPEKNPNLRRKLSLPVFCKVTITGDSQTGKTKLIQKIDTGKFIDKYEPTIGCEFKVKSITSSNNKPTKLHVWDSSGQEKFKNSIQSYYDGAHGAIICYSINNRKSFDNIEDWLGQFRASNTTGQVV